jgi:hypothetical protein
LLNSPERETKPLSKRESVPRKEQSSRKDEEKVNMQNAAKVAEIVVGELKLHRLFEKMAGDEVGDKKTEAVFAKLEVFLESTPYAGREERLEKAAKLIAAYLVSNAERADFFFEEKLVPLVMKGGRIQEMSPTAVIWGTFMALNFEECEPSNPAGITISTSPKLDIVFARHCFSFVKEGVVDLKRIFDVLPHIIGRYFSTQKYLPGSQSLFAIRRDLWIDAIRKEFVIKDEKIPLEMSLSSVQCTFLDYILKALFNTQSLRLKLQGCCW